MPSLLSRITFPIAIVLASVLVHLGLFGVIVLAERRTLFASETQTIDVELVKPEEIPQPARIEPAKIEPPKPPEPPKAVEQKIRIEPASPPPAAAPALSNADPRQLETKSAKADPQAPPDPLEKPEKPDKPAAPSGGPPSESKSKLTPEEIAALRAQVQKCWQLPVGMPGVIGLELVIRVSFGAKGQLAGEPVLLKAPASERGPLLVGIAMKALKDCAPYRMPSAKYNDWKALDLRFLATGMTGLGVAPKLPPQAKQ